MKQKVPRRTKPPTLWEKFLGLIGLGPKPRPQPRLPEQPGRHAATAGGQATPREEQARREKPQGGPSKSAKRDRQPALRIDKKPERVPVSGTRLHVGNLSYDTTDADLEAFFAEVGPVAKAEVVAHRNSGRSKGFAFVEMAELADAQRAAEHLHDRDFMGRKISVTGAKSAGPGS